MNYKNYKMYNYVMKFYNNDFIKLAKSNIELFKELKIISKKSKGIVVNKGAIDKRSGDKLKPSIIKKLEPKLKARSVQILKKALTNKINFSVTVTRKFYNRNEDGTYRLMGEKTKTENSIIKDTRRARIDFLKDLEEREYRYDRVETTFVNIENTPLPLYLTSIENTAYQRAGVEDLDGIRITKNNVWSKDRNMCFVDMIQYKLTGKKGFIKKITDEKIQELSLINCWGHDEYIDQYPNKNGYTMRHMINYFNKINASYYILNDGYIFSCKHNQNNGREVAFVFELKNKHIYPVFDKTYIKSIVEKNTTELCKVVSDLSDEKEFKRKIKPIVEFDNECVERNINYAIKQMIKHKIMSYDKKITMTNGILSNFILDDKLYLSQPCIHEKDKHEQEAIKKYCADKGIEYQGQVPQLFTKEYLKAFTEKSYFNKRVEKALFTDNVKDRVHFGICHQEFYKLFQYKDNLKCWDIIKCYKSIMMNPIEDWYIIDYHHTVQDTDKMQGSGLYFIESDDSTLFHGNNWYSSAILEYARMNSIRFSIRAYIPVRTISKDSILKVIETIEEDIKDKATQKLVINCIFGYLGQTKYKQVHLNVDSDINKVWGGLKKCPKKSDFYFHTYHAEKCDYYAYGEQQTVMMKSNNLPMAIQIQDQANIKLHQMIKKMGGTCIYRKTDMAVCYSKEFKPQKDFDDKVIGGHRSEKLPDEETLMYEKSIHNRHVEFYHEHPWKQMKYKVSDDYQAIIDEAFKRKGLMLIGRAGTGKTYISKQLIKQLEENKIGHAKLAFTNKASRNLDGQTIHTFLGLNGEDRLTDKSWIKKRGKNLQVVIVDEISMISAILWKHLEEFKRATGCIFILLGDSRQLAPVCDSAGKDFDWFNHPSVKYLANYTKCELSEMSVNGRYDKVLWDFLEDITTGEWTDKTKDKMDTRETIRIKDLITRTNISYTNKTRKWINHLVQEELTKNKDYKFMRYEGNDDDYQQNAKLFVGCKLLLNTTPTIKGIGKPLKKNELVTVTEMNKETFKVQAECDDNEYEFDYGAFHRVFILGYCITYHKSQGDTIKGEVNIFDVEFVQWMGERKPLYTALSRATCLEHIHVMKRPFIPSCFCPVYKRKITKGDMKKLGVKPKMA